MSSFFGQERVLWQGSEAIVSCGSLLFGHQQPKSINISDDQSNLKLTNSYIKCVLKKRFKKGWRHPSLDLKLNERRISLEAKCLAKAKEKGIPVPTVFLVDIAGLGLYMEYLPFDNLKTFLLDNEKVNEKDDNTFVHIHKKIEAALAQNLAKLHSSNIIHGDLTTSNILVSSGGKDEDASLSLYFIDFGLAFVSSQLEEKAVDLYVLERAIDSTHPNMNSFSQYLALLDPKTSKAMSSKYQEVRMRGRKRSMIG